MNAVLSVNTRLADLDHVSYTPTNSYIRIPTEFTLGRVRNNVLMFDFKQAQR